jgi:ribosome-binding protein aMBF1 (putative translation factor)
VTPATKTDIGQRIRQEREALGLSREGLAYKAGVAAKTIERIEAGKVMPRRATLTVIETALAGCEPEGVAA